jgi:RimJ/RimL family protein N-acetyltransferase
MITAIDTDRLTLRNYRDQDAAALLEYRAHPTVHCFVVGIATVQGEHMRVGDEGLEPTTTSQLRVGAI